MIRKDSLLPELARDSWRLSWPMTFIMLYEFFVGLSDVYVAGRLGKEVQATYGFAFQVYFLFIIVAIALSVGAVSVVSQLFTAAQKKEFHDAVATSLTVAIVSGLVFGIIGIVGAYYIVGIVRVPETLKGTATALLRIYSVGFVFDYILIATNSILRSCGMIQRSLFTMTLVCVINIVLNFALALGTPLGVTGIAWATVISLGLGATLNVHFTAKLAPLRVRFSRAIMQKLLHISWPSGVMQIIWQLGSLGLFMILSSLPKDSIQTIAALTNGLKIESAIFLPAFAFNMANAVVVGNFIGKKDGKNAFRGGIVTAALGVGIVTVMTALIMLHARFIAAQLSSSEAVVRESIRYIYIALIAEPIMAWGVILGGGLNGAGDTRNVMIIAAFSVWLIRIPLAYTLGIFFGFGPAAIWWSMNVSLLVQALLISWRFFSKRWIGGIILGTSEKSVV